MCFHASAVIRSGPLDDTVSVMFETSNGEAEAGMGWGKKCCVLLVI